MQSDYDANLALIATFHREKAELHTDLCVASDYMATLEEKVYTANKTSLDLLKQIKDDEEEIVSLKKVIVDLKAKVSVYIPCRDDPLDSKLADYINNYPDR